MSLKSFHLRVIQNLNYFIHLRMFPKYNLDDSLAAIERLGKKKETAVHMTRYRLGQLTKDDDRVILSEEEDDTHKFNEAHMNLNAPIDEFDALIDEQIALSTNRINNDSVDKSFGNISAISSSAKHYDRVSSTQVYPQSQSSQQNQSSQNSQQASAPVQTAVSEEVRQRIAENKRKAMAILEARKKAAEEERKRKELEERSQEVSSINIDDDY